MYTIISFWVEITLLHVKLVTKWEGYLLFRILGTVFLIQFFFFNVFQPLVTCPKR